MESMAYIHHSSPLAGAEFSSVGKLRLQQSGPLPHKGTHTVYNVSYCVAKMYKRCLGTLVVCSLLWLVFSVFQFLFVVS